MGAYETQGFKLDNSGRRVVVDPVTRIEGHMRCEVTSESFRITWIARPSISVASRSASSSGSSVDENSPVAWPPRMISASCARQRWSSTSRSLAISLSRSARTQTSIHSAHSSRRPNSGR